MGVRGCDCLQCDLMMERRMGECAEICHVFYIPLTNASHMSKPNVSGAETTLSMLTFADDFKNHHTHEYLLLLNVNSLFDLNQGCPLD